MAGNDGTRELVMRLGRDIAEMLGERTGATYEVDAGRDGRILAFRLLDAEGGEWLRTTATSWDGLRDNVGSLHLAAMI